MKGVLLSNAHPKVRGNLIYSSIVSFFFKPFVSGLYGFAAFFTVLIFTKGISHFIGITDQYIVSSDDVLFSVLGFIMVFIIKLFESIKNRTTI